MSRGYIDNIYLTNIADALRAKTGTNNKYTPAQMGPAINNLITEGAIVTTDATLNNNAYLLAGNSAYANGLKYEGTMVDRGSKVFNPTTSQQTGAAGYYSDITVTPIQVETRSIVPTTSAQQISPNTGNYLAGVSVSAVTNAIDTNITAANIKKDVTILGVTGFYEGLNEIDVNTSRIKFGFSEWDSVPGIYNFSNVMNFDDMFNSCPNLYNVSNVNFSKATSVSDVFYNCKNLKVIENIDWSSISTGSTYAPFALTPYSPSVGTIVKSSFNICNIKNLAQFFSYSRFRDIESLNTISATSMYEMFEYFDGYNIGALNADNVVNISKVFGSDSYSGCNNLNSFGGFINLGNAYNTRKAASFSNYKLSFQYANKITHDSLVNVIGNLYNIAAKGCNTQILNLGTSLSKINSDEISVATAKGWTVN